MFFPPKRGSESVQRHRQESSVGAGNHMSVIFLRVVPVIRVEEGVQQAVRVDEIAEEKKEKDGQVEGHGGARRGGCWDVGERGEGSWEEEQEAEEVGQLGQVQGEGVVVVVPEDKGEVVQVEEEGEKEV